MHFYYEPGMGLRYFIGGDYFKDYDFWSEDVQSKLDEAVPIEKILEDLKYPNLYVLSSYGYGNWMETESYKNYLDEIKSFEESPYVRNSICEINACFHITGPRELKTTSACLE